MKWNLFSWLITSNPGWREIFDYIRNELIRAGFNGTSGRRGCADRGNLPVARPARRGSQEIGHQCAHFRPKQIGVTDPSFTASTAVLQFIARHDPLILLKPQTRRKSSAWGDKIKALMRDLFG